MAVQVEDFNDPIPNSLPVEIDKSVFLVLRGVIR
jgi:hypothetical protein